MRFLYWNNQHLDYLNEDDIYVFTDNIESGSNPNTNNGESGDNPYTNNAEIGGSNSNFNELKIIKDKIQIQYDYNKSSASRRFSIYSVHYPPNAQLTNHECAILHKHLVDLDKGYDLRLVSTDVFRIYLSSTSKAQLKPTLNLVSDLDS